MSTLEAPLPLQASPPQPLSVSQAHPRLAYVALLGAAIILWATIASTVLGIVFGIYVGIRAATDTSHGGGSTHVTCAGGVDPTTGKCYQLTP